VKVRQYRKGAEQGNREEAIGNSEYRKGAEAQRHRGGNRQEAIVNTEKGQRHKARQ
jgi:hypothetical protein